MAVAACAFNVWSSIPSIARIDSKKASFPSLKFFGSTLSAFKTSFACVPVFCRFVNTRGNCEMIVFALSALWPEDTKASFKASMFCADTLDRADRSFKSLMLSTTERDNSNEATAASMNAPATFCTAPTTTPAAAVNPVNAAPIWPAICTPLCFVLSSPPFVCLVCCCSFLSPLTASNTSTSISYSTVVLISDPPSQEGIYLEIPYPFCVCLF